MILGTSVNGQSVKSAARSREGSPSRQSVSATLRSLSPKKTASPPQLRQPPPPTPPRRQELQRTRITATLRGRPRVNRNRKARRDILLKLTRNPASSPQLLHLLPQTSQKHLHPPTLPSPHGLRRTRRPIRLSRPQLRGARQRTRLSRPQLRGTRQRTRLSRPQLRRTRQRTRLSQP